MNERIKQLAEQAQQYAEYTTPQGLEWLPAFKEKFAELIIQECMDCSLWVGKVNKNAVEPIHTAHAINLRIKKHFGVEE